MRLTEECKFESEYDLRYISLDNRLNSILKGALLRENEAWDCAYREIHESKAYIFTGVQGNGKKVLVEAFAGTAERCGYKAYHISAVDLFGTTQEETLDEISELLENIERKCSNENEKYFLIFEDLWIFQDDTRAGKLLFSRLYNLMENSAAHIIAATTFDCAPSRLPSFFRGRAAHVIPVKLPDSEKRQKYLKAYMEEFFCPENHVTAEFIAKQTEGFTYGELDILCKDLMLFAKGKYLDDSGEEAGFIDDPIPTNAVTTDILTVDVVNELIEDITLCRYVKAEYGTGKSICNYPQTSVAAMPVTAAVVPSVPTSEVKSNIDTEQDDKDNVPFDPSEIPDKLNSSLDIPRL